MARMTKRAMVQRHAHHRRWRREGERRHERRWDRRGREEHGRVGRGRGWRGGDGGRRGEHSELKAILQTVMELKDKVAAQHDAALDVLAAPPVCHTLAYIPSPKFYTLIYHPHKPAMTPAHKMRNAL